MIDTANTTRTQVVSVPADPPDEQPDLAIYQDGALYAPTVTWTQLSATAWRYSYTAPASGKRVLEVFTHAGWAEDLQREYKAVEFGAAVGVSVSPVVVQVPHGRYQPTQLNPVEQNSAPTDQLLVVDANNDDVDLRGRNLLLGFHKAAQGQMTPVFRYTSYETGARLTIGDTDALKNQLTVAWHQDNTATPMELHWVLWDTEGDEVLGRGTVNITAIPDFDDYPAGGGES
jgi:hypothetical protein